MNYVTISLIPIATFRLLFSLLVFCSYLYLNMNRACFVQDPRVADVLDEVVQEALDTGITGLCVNGTHEGDWEKVSMLRLDQTRQKMPVEDLI